MTDLLDVLPPVRDQGDRATCLSLALTDGHHGTRRVGPPLAADFLHYHAAAHAGTNVNLAVSDVAGVFALGAMGQPAEAECPYLPTPLPCTWEPPTPTGSVWRRDARVRDDDVAARVSEELGHGRPAVLVLHIDDVFWEPSNGELDAPAGPVRACHAVLAVSMDGSRVLIRNSWGEEWGSAGYCWLSQEYLASRCSRVIVFGGAP